MTCPVGEQQRAALAKVLLREPQILLLDEPTKGLDSAFKESFAGILKQLTAQGVCVILVSHDVEFCAAYGDRCALFFDGGIVAEDAPVPFFSGKAFTPPPPAVWPAASAGGHYGGRWDYACGGRLPPKQERQSLRLHRLPGKARLPGCPCGEDPGRPVRRRSPGSFLPMPSWPWT